MGQWEDDAPEMVEQLLATTPLRDLALRRLPLDAGRCVSWTNLYGGREYGVVVTTGIPFVVVAVEASGGSPHTRPLLAVRWDMLRVEDMR